MSLSRLILVTAITISPLLGCTNGPQPDNGNPTLDNSTPEQATKALKDKFFAEHNCAVYENIDTFMCSGGLMQATCKDNNGMIQTDYYLQDPTNATNWLSESDVQAEISMAQANLMAAQAKLTGFTQAMMPGYMCNIN